MSRAIYFCVRCLGALILFLIVAPHQGVAQSAPVILAGFPTLKQQLTLTCEASSASMGTRGAITESQLMSVIPRDPNPNFGFRGNPNGVQGTALIDYGVYAQPLQRALVRYGYHSETLSYARSADIESYINQGWPVVAWMTYRLQPASPRLGMANGSSFILVPHEHAILITGYDSATVYGNDPWTGRQVRYSWRAFVRSWGLFGRIGLAIEPCPEPLPVKRVTVARLNSAGLTWSWNRAKNAAQYDVTVTLHAAKDHVEFHGSLTVHRFTLPAPISGASYEIAVRAMSACGGSASPTRQWFNVPAALPTPIPTSAPATATPTAVSATPQPTTQPTTVHS